MKAIIWVFGASASGKQTFIKKLLSDIELQATFDLTGSQIAVSNEGFNNLGKLGKSRASIPGEVSRLLESNDAVVIKWQYGDTLLGTPNILRAKYPSYKHSVIQLEVKTPEHKRRLRIKSWWHDEGEEDEFITKDLELVKDSIKKLNGAFVITKQKW